jgi:TonB-linked SusC/RagA family outer membrane protein
MKKKWMFNKHRESYAWMRFFRIMKLTAFFLLFTLISVSASVYSQVTRLDLKAQSQTVKELLNKIEDQSNFFFMYNDRKIDVQRKIDVDLKQAKIEDILETIFEGTTTKFTIRDHQIVLYSESQEESGGFGSQLGAQQQKSVSGKVTDTSGQALPGVSVVIKGTTIGAISDANGNFLINNVQENAILQFSFIGMKKQEVAVADKTMVNVKMIEETIGIDEVVAIGYGVQKKETLSGSIASIKGNELLTTKSPNLVQSLQGKISGVQIRQNSSIPGGGATTINIRGFGTPLIVIDGVLRDGVSEFEHLDPNDIESISVLKDGAAAIYGIGASNGVLIVTTKQGGKGAMKVSFSGNFGWSSPTDLPKPVSSYDWIDLKNELSVNRWNGMAYSQEEIQKYKEGTLPGYESVNWYNEVMKNSAAQEQYNLSVQGGTDISTYFVSMGYTKDNGLVKNNPLNYEQVNFRANSGIKLSKSLKLDINISGRYDVNNQIAGGFTNILQGINAAAPFQKPYINDDMNYPAFIASGTNPLALLRPDLNGYSRNKTNLIRSSMDLVYDVPGIKGLQVKVFGAYDLNFIADKDLQRQIQLYKLDPVSGQAVVASTFANNNISVFNSNAQRVNLQGQISYNTSIANKHNVSAMMLYEQRKNDYSTLKAKRYYDFYTIDVLNQASLANQETDGSESEAANMSYIGRFNYDYMKKYLAEFVFRYDGSYRYNPDQRWGFFPGISLGWRISEEDFIKNNLRFIDNLKLRASYGETGEDAGNPFQYVEGYQTGQTTGYEFVNGEWTSRIMSPSLINRNLTWYSSKTYNTGFDFDIIKGQLGLTFDVYRRNRSGLLATRSLSLPNTFGASLPQENLNSDRVQGIDFDIRHRNKIRNFTYSVGFNMNISQAMDLYVEKGAYQSSYSKWRYDNSYRNKNVLWGYEVIGRFQNWEQIRNYPVFMDGGSGNVSQLPGDPIYRDVNGDGMISAEDARPIYWGAQQPPLQYGLNLSGSWKGLDFSLLLQGAARYTIDLGTEWQTPMYSDRSAPDYLTDRWHLSDPSNKDSEWIPGYFPAGRNPLDAPSLRFTNNIYSRSANYLRLKNLELGYSIPGKMINRVNIDKCRVYVNGTNLYTFTDKILKMFDPERGENYAYPLNKSINIGMNVTF